MATHKDSTIVNPDPLGAAVDRVVAIIQALMPDRAELAAELGRALGDLFAELIGRAASQSASAIVSIHGRVEGLERRDHARDERIRLLVQRVDAQIDALWREQPVDQSVTVYHNSVAIEELRQAVAALKERQTGDGATE